MPINSPENQITLYFNPETDKGKKTLAYAKTYKLAISEVDVRKSPLTGTQLLNIADMLGIPLNELADSESPYYKEIMGEAKDFDDNDWITVLTENQSLMKLPIALRGNKAIVVATPTDILRI